MAKHYKLKTDDLPNLALKMEDWSGNVGGLDHTGLFAMQDCNPNGEWDWYEIGGGWDGQLKDNVVPAESLLKAKGLKSMLPAKMVTPNGKWHAREEIAAGRIDVMVVKKTDQGWLQEVRDALKTFKECRVVCVDIHS